jgi:2-iminobutanoate/2-iminopropanoate deaminase
VSPTLIAPILPSGRLARHKEAKQRGSPVPKSVPTLPSAPKPLAPYSVATEANGFVFLSGQVAIDPSGGPTPEDVVGQARLVLDNIGRILTDLGLSFDDIVKTTIFLKDIADFAAINAEYGSYFTDEPPARSTIQAGALPKPEYLIEIEAIVAR